MMNLCPKCFLTFLSWDESLYSETCCKCGYTRLYDPKTRKVLEEYGGYGLITYVDGRTGAEAVVPFEESMTRVGAKTAFTRYFKKLQDAKEKTLSWFDCERHVLSRYDFTNETWHEDERKGVWSTNDLNPRWEDGFSFRTPDEEAFLAEIDETELESIWIDQLRSRDLILDAIASPIEVGAACVKYGLDMTRTYENAEDGTSLILKCGEQWFNVSSIARSTLISTAKLGGSALERMNPIVLAQTLNNGLSVATGESLVLVRHGKVMAVHSSSTYCVMPISSLIEATKEALSVYGQVSFVKGYHSNSYTMGMWSLPDVQHELMDKYQKALSGSACANHAINFMPICRFSASDTAHSAASLRPMFLKPNGVAFSISDGISVRHEKSLSGGEYGIDRYKSEAGMIFSKFLESFELLEKMAKTEIFNPLNCVVGLFNWVNRRTVYVPRKYAAMVREEVERYAVGAPSVTMHDLYLSMVECVGYAGATCSATNLKR